MTSYTFFVLGRANLDGTVQYEVWVTLDLVPVWVSDPKAGTRFDSAAAVSEAITRMNTRYVTGPSVGLMSVQVLDTEATATVPGVLVPDPDAPVACARALVRPLAAAMELAQVHPGALLTLGEAVGQGPPLGADRLAAILAGTGT